MKVGLYFFGFTVNLFFLDIEEIVSPDEIASLKPNRLCYMLVIVSLYEKGMSDMSTLLELVKNKLTCVVGKLNC